MNRISLAITLGVAFIAGLFLWLYWEFSKGPVDRAVPTCFANFKGIYVAMAMYASDFDDRLPLESEWMGELHPYRSIEFFKCPAVEPGGYGYALRQGVGGRKFLASESVGDVIVFESTDTQFNAVARLQTLPVPSRHGEGNYVLFSDGHIVSH